MVRRKEKKKHNRMGSGYSNPVMAEKCKEEGYTYSIDTAAAVDNGSEIDCGDRQTARSQKTLTNHDSANPKYISSCSCASLGQKSIMDTYYLWSNRHL